MEITYSPLLHIYLRHAYFTSGINQAMEVAPFGPTAALLRQFQLRWQQRDFGYTLFYETSGNRPPPLLNSAGPVLLTFTLRPRDPLFTNYTALPLNGTEAASYYFSNWETSDGQLTPSLANRHRVLPPSFVLRDLSPDDLSIRDAADNEHGEGTIQAMEGLSVRIDLSSSAPGRYTLFQGTEPYLTFIGGSHPLPPGDVGLLQCLVSIDSLPASVTDLSLSFDARLTRWRYLLVESATEEAETVTYSIKEESPPPDVPTVAFVEAPATRRLANGQEAVELVADTPVALRQRPERQFLLSKSAASASGTETTTLPLPAPAASRIIPGPDPENEAYFSDLFIYL